MREIKFRGFDEKNNKWVYGDLFHGYPDIFILVNESFDNYNKVSHVYVKPETVGQYIGLKDKNLKEIYEGDILADMFECSLIEYDEASAKFVLRIQDQIDEVTFNEIKHNGYILEVGGNIHENPELFPDYEDA